MYIGLMDRLAMEYHRESGTKVKPMKYIKAVTKKDITILHGSNGCILGEEYYWKLHSKRVYEVINMDKLLVRGFSSEDDIKIPCNSFTISFPNSHTLNGRKVTGCLVTYDTWDQRHKHMYNPLIKHATNNSHKHAYHKDTEEGEENVLSIAFTIEGKSPVYYMSVLPEKILPALNTKDGKEFADLLGDYDDNHDLDMLEHSEPLTFQEWELQRQLLLVVCNVCSLIVKQDISLKVANKSRLH